MKNYLLPLILIAGSLPAHSAGDEINNRKTDTPRNLVIHDAGKISRITGRSLEGETLPNPNRTDERYNLGGTDLGIIWELSKGRYGLIFGDSYGSKFKPIPGGGPGPTGGPGDWRSNVIAFCEDTELDDGLAFSGMLTAPENPRRAIEVIPRRENGDYTSIPTAAIELDGVQYVHYMYWQVGTDDAPENYASIYRSPDNGKTWQSCRDQILFDRYSNFGTVGYAKQGGYCYMLGTHIGRSGSAYLARFRYKNILDKEKYEFWNGEAGRWVRGDEKAATIVLDGTVGELSVAYHNKYKCWIVLYFDADRYAICYRTAAQIEGPWSEEQVLVSGEQYPGLYGSYIHPASLDGDDLYYTLSEWFPYNVFLMKARIGYTE